MKLPKGLPILDQVGLILRRSQNVFTDTSLVKCRQQENGIWVVTLYLASSGCVYASRGGCTMCAYPKQKPRLEPLDLNTFIVQLNSALQNVPAEALVEVRLFTGGSAFDFGEISSENISRICSVLLSDHRIVKLRVETLLTFLNHENLSLWTNLLQPIRLEIAIGIESCNRFFRKFCINKPFEDEEMRHLIELAAGYADIVCYLMLGHIFLTEKESVDDVIASTFELLQLPVHRIDINPLHIHNHTIAGHLFRANMAFPPSLCSIDLVRTIFSNHSRVNITGLSPNPLPVASPMSCAICQSAFLDDIKQKRPFVGCPCYVAWSKSYRTPSGDLLARIEAGYTHLAESFEVPVEASVRQLHSAESVYGDKTLAIARARAVNCGLHNEFIGALQKLMKIRTISVSIPPETVLRMYPGIFGEDYTYDVLNSYHGESICMICEGRGAVEHVLRVRNDLRMRFRDRGTNFFHAADTDGEVALHMRLLGLTI